MINAAIRKSDKVITISEFSKKEITKYADVKGKDIKIIYCGLNIEELKTKMNKQSFDQVKAFYKLPEDYFLYVGSIKPHKNLKTALKAFNIWLKKSSCDKKLVIIGVRPDEINKDSELSKLFDKNRIIVPGFVKDFDLTLIYNNAECLIFPSIYEGFGLPPLEAMIYGCPVIASNSASIPEVCGDAALYFEPLKYEELAEKMTMLTTHKSLRTELIEKGYRNSFRYGWERFAQNLKHEFDDAIIN